MWEGYDPDCIWLLARGGDGAAKDVTTLGATAGNWGILGAFLELTVGVCVASAPRREAIGSVLSSKR